MLILYIIAFLLNVSRMLFTQGDSYLLHLLNTGVTLDQGSQCWYSNSSQTFKHQYQVT